MTTNMNIIDITNDVTEIKEEETMTENTNMTTIEKETTVDEAFAEAVSLIPEELIEVEDGKQFERSSETVTIKTLINRYKKGTIQIPKCQRLYVWKESDVDLLADSILHNFPMGIIIIGECEKAPVGWFAAHYLDCETSFLGQAQQRGQERNYRLQGCG